MASLSAWSLPGIPEVRPGEDLPALLRGALAGRSLTGTEVVAIAHTVVSKAEGALVALSEVQPGERALELAEQQRRDPRVVQVILDESAEVLRAERGVLISRTHHGFVCANAGVDASNSIDSETVVLLPRDPDASARRIRAGLAGSGGAHRGTGPPAVLISDTFGRAWRHGQTDVAVGLAGMAPLDDWRGRTDAGGLQLAATWLAIADAVAGAADLARSKDSGEPVVIVEGLGRFVTEEDGPGAAALVRPPEEDLFL